MALLPKLDEELKPEVIHWAAFYEHRIRLGSKVIFHLEAFVAKGLTSKSYTDGSDENNCRIFDGIILTKSYLLKYDIISEVNLLRIDKPLLALNLSDLYALPVSRFTAARRMCLY